MVRQQGKLDGIGIWEVDGHDAILPTIRDAFERFTEEQEFVDPDTVSLEDVLVVGSYGDGSGVPGKSDLDLVLSVSYLGDLRSNDFSRFLRHACGAVVEADVTDEVDGVDEADVLAYPMLEVRGHVKEMATHGPVETYYSLVDDERRDYFPHHG